MADIEERMEMELPPQEDSPAMFETEFDTEFPTAESAAPAFGSNFIEEDMVSEQFSKPHDLSAIQEEKKEDEPEEQPHQTREEEQDDDDEEDEEEEEEKRYSSRRRKGKSRSRRNRSKKSMPEDATPQELYAIGAVFEHLYRGGSPSKCIRVYQKEMSRAPELSMFGRGVYRRDDDDWTYNDVDTIDDNGTSYMSVDETTIFSSSAVTRKMPEKPWDEESAQNVSASRIAPFLKNAKNGAKAKLDLGTQMWSEMAGIATKTNEQEAQGPEEQNESSEKPTTPVVEDKETSRDETNMAIVDDKKLVQDKNADEEDSCLDDILGEREEEEAEETKPSSDPNESTTEEPVVLAKENEETAEKEETEPAQESDSQDEESKGPGPAVTMEDVKALVGMFRKTIAGRLPEDNKSLQTALARVFSCHGRSEDVADTVQELRDAVETDDLLTEERPLNHLAKKMQSIAMKEPTQTFAISEQHQIVEKEENVGSDEALQRQQSEDKAVLSLPSEQNSIIGVSNTSLSGGSKANSEDVGSHRGDAAAPTSTQPKPRVPSSIQMHTIQKESADASFSSEGSDKAQITFVGVADPSPRRKLPPMPPTKSSAPLPAVCVSNDSDATDMGVIDSFEVRIGAEKNTVTPPRPTKKNSSRFLGGISIKKRFSFRKNKKATPKKEESPRSTMMVDNSVFQSSRDKKNLNDSADACIGVALADALVDDSIDDVNDESMIVKQLNFDESATTNGVLMTQTNDFAYEVESV